jgi:Threonine aldolase
MEKKFFFSDNTSGVHPLIMDAIVKGNSGHAKAYGEDDYSLKAKEIIKEILGKECYSTFVLGGTGGNILALDSLMRSYQGLICSDCSHIHTTETGAFEKIVGAKIYPTIAKNGKIDLLEARKYLEDNKNNIHHNQPKVISIAQTTEVGTVYEIEEIKEICDFAHENGLYVHVDGARIANALVSLNCTLKEMISDTGVDVLTLGGTKNGMMFGEVNIYFDESLYNQSRFLQKQNLQLISKMRYISIQFIEYFREDLYLKIAKESNDLMNVFKDSIEELKAVKLLYPIESNQAFIRIPIKFSNQLINKYEYAILSELEDETDLRLVTTFINTKEEVFELINDLKNINSFIGGK